MLPLFHPALLREDRYANSPEQRNRQPPLFSTSVGHRFAVVISNRRDWRHANRQLKGYRASPALKSQNCAAKRKLERRESSLYTRKKEADLNEAISALQDMVADLERSQCLTESAHLMRRTNRMSSAVEIVQDYMRIFCRGYDSGQIEETKVKDSFMRSNFEPDMFCREFKGITKFKEQWENYTKYHGNFVARLCAVNLVDEDDRYVSIRTCGELRVVFTEKTLKHLYPSLYKQTQSNPALNALANSIYDRECVLPLEMVLHFNEKGKLFAQESSVHLASGLLELLRDPQLVISFMDASLMSAHGHWKFTPDEFNDSSYKLPKVLL